MGILVNGDILKNKSIWSDEKNNKHYRKLENDLNYDVLIIGGGLTGISCAYYLINSGLNVCVVEKNNIGQGVTSRTTGKITYLQENVYSKIRKYHNKKKAKSYLESQIYAVNLVKKIIEKENINCNLEKVKSYVFSVVNNYKLDKERKLLESFGISLKLDNKLPNDTKVKKAFFIDDSYVFHPLKYLYSLTDICFRNNISIYENTKILSINKKDNLYFCKTENNLIKAKYVILASHYPYFLKPYFFPFKVSLEKSYIGAIKVNSNYKFSAISISKPTLSLRYHECDDIYQLVLANSHNLCIKFNERKNFNKLSLKENSFNYIWSNKDIITADALPIIGSLNNDNTLLIGTGYNTWGMTNASLAGKILADVILKKKNPYINLFNPRRGINLGKIINFPIVLFSNASSFAKTKINKNKKWYSNNVRFEKRNGKCVGIYTDDNNKEHIVYNLCPHLKCSLIFNEIEKTWDCPCHGSRFDIDGKSIEGPSNYDISFKED